MGESFALRRKINAVRPVFGVDRLYRRTYRLGHHNHSRAAEGIIVALEVLVFGIVADIDDINFEFARVHRPADNTAEQRRERFGKQRKHGDFQTDTSLNRLLFTVIILFSVSTSAITPSAAGKEISLPFTEIV